MIDTFLNLLKLDAQNFIVEVWWVALTLWLALVLMGISDIATNTLTRGGKAGWIITIVLVPIVGLFAYCLFCLTRVDYHWLDFLLMKGKSSRQKNSKISAANR